MRCSSRNTRGHCPLWLAPEQARILPISERHHDTARAVYEKLCGAGLRVELDERSEKIGYKIREAQLQKIPYMLVVGDKEAESGTVSVRMRGEAISVRWPLMIFGARVLE